MRHLSTQTIRYFETELEDSNEVQHEKAEDLIGFYLMSENQEDYIDNIWDHEVERMLPALVGKFLHSGKTEDARNLADFLAVKTKQNYLPIVQKVAEDVLLEKQLQLESELNNWRYSSDEMDRPL